MVMTSYQVVRVMIVYMAIMMRIQSAVVLVMIELKAVLGMT